MHAVSFVVQGNSTRLDSRNKWIFDQVLSLFGKDVGEIITLLMTFSDAAEPPAMSVINDAKIDYKQRFKLNNSAYVLTENAVTEHDCAVNSLFWGVGQCAFEAFSKFVCEQTERIDLQNTKTVLSRRDKLKAGIENTREQINLGMMTLDRVDDMIPQIMTVQTLMECNKDFQFEVTEMKTVKKPKVAAFNTVCDNCSWTCHRDCIFANDGDKMGCSAMDKKSGHCEHCPNKCHWSAHKNLDYYYDRVPIKKKQTNTELYDRYVNAKSDKSKYDQVGPTVARVFLSLNINTHLGSHFQHRL